MEEMSRKLSPAEGFYLRRVAMQRQYAFHTLPNDAFVMS